VRAEIKHIHVATLVIFYMYNAEKLPSVPSQWVTCSDQGNSISILKQLYGKEFLVVHSNSHCNLTVISEVSQSLSLDQRPWRTSFKLGHKGSES